MNKYIQNHTFDEMAAGDLASIARKLSKKDIKLFAAITGDVNPAHLDEEYAKSDMFHKIVAHGMWSATFFSTLLGTKLPGPGTIYLAQTLNFTHPVSVGDTITATVRIVNKIPEKHIVEFECQCVNQDNVEVVNGMARVIAPTEKIKRKRIMLPQVLLKKHK